MNPHPSQQNYIFITVDDESRQYLSWEYKDGPGGHGRELHTNSHYEPMRAMEVHDGNMDQYTWNEIKKLWSTAKFTVVHINWETTMKYSNYTDIKI